MRGTEPPFQGGEEVRKRENIVVHVGVGDRKNPWISVKAVEILREKLNLKLVITGGAVRYKKGLCRSCWKTQLKGICRTSI
jgi:spore coat polysaccharide biosynthesis predicted glycosyltransferase SpsG